MADLDGAGGVPGDDAPAVAGEADFILGEGLEERAIEAFGEGEDAQIGGVEARHVVERGEEEAREVVERIEVDVGVEMDAEVFHSGVEGGGGVRDSMVAGEREKSRSRPRRMARRGPPGESSPPINKVVERPLRPWRNTVTAR